MAKTREAVAGARTAVEEEPLTLSAKVEKAVDAIRKPFSDYSKGFTALEEKRRDLAPKFMKAANLWQAETGKTFVDFVRYLNPDIGQSRAEYRNHPVYQAADYLRRVKGNEARRGQGSDQQGEQGPPPAAPTNALARILASLVAIIPEKEQPKLWDVMRQELNWDEGRVENMQRQIENVDPLVQIKGRTFDTMKLTFPEHTHQEEAASAAA